MLRFGDVPTTLYMCVKNKLQRSTEEIVACTPVCVHWLTNGLPTGVTDPEDISSTPRRV
jgi:hypothetical protein